MLAIGRALMTNPRFSSSTRRLRARAAHSRRDLVLPAGPQDEGEAILVIDKNVGALLALADRHVVIEKGRVAWTGHERGTRHRPRIKERFLHV